MEDKAIRILDIVDQYSNLDDVYGETREELIGWIVEILEEEEQKILMEEDLGWKA